MISKVLKSIILYRYLQICMKLILTKMIGFSCTKLKVKSGFRENISILVLPKTTFFFAFAIIHDFSALS